MRTNITYELVQSFSPCYELSTIGVTSDYSATIPEFIREYRHKVKHKHDILWVLLRNIFLTNQELRLFAVWCARQVQHLIIDKRCIEATSRAADAAYAAAGYNADRAAYDAAHDAACAYAAASAARAASAAAAYEAAYEDVAAAYAGARADADDAQIDKLLEIFEKKDAA